MKSYLILVLFIFGLMTSNAQDLTDKEYRLNVFELISGPALGLSYEKFWNSQSSYGVYTFINLNKESLRDENFEVAPYVRFYFKETEYLYGKSLFLELFTSFVSGEAYTIDDILFYDDDYSYPSNYDENKFNRLALGAMVGKKWVNKSNVTFETGIGVGRYLSGSVGSGNTVYPRLHLSIGKQF
tara:strand:- start:7995 stop:8546 length:552 start_codon:yes stop_codon:yes gene_type:complete